jgi:hypothetical protein
MATRLLFFPAEWISPDPNLNNKSAAARFSGALLESFFW